MKRILAIDDNQNNLELLKYAIKSHFSDYEYITALNGREGIELVNEKSPDLILLDILMPEMDGYEVCNRLKSDPATNHIPILMISALGKDSDERSKGLNAGADAFISKPFSVKELCALINVSLRIKSAEDALRKRNESLELAIKNQAYEYFQKEERLQQVSEHVREFYWETDNNGIFIYISPVVESILKTLSRDIINNKHFTELFQVKDRNTHLVLSEETENRDNEISLLIGDATLYFSLNSFPVFNTDGKFLGNRGVCFDITNRKKIEFELKNKFEEINNYQLKLKKLSYEIARIQESERKRIAENLHDSLGQTLSLAYLKLSSLFQKSLPDNVGKIISDTADLLKQAVTESRNLTYDLSPPILYELGLIPALNWKLEQVQKLNGLQTNFNIESQPAGLKKEDEIFIFRMVCELIANVIKHAKASKLDMEFKKNKKSLYIIVRDNGVGFDSTRQLIASESGGFGLISIKERLEDINGKLYIESKINKGTEARIELIL